MKLGLITDIHEHVVTLRRAIEHLAELKVDKIVMIGDVVEMGRRLVVEECHFSHVEPWLDPTKLEDLWHFAGKPSEHGDFSRIFAATPQRLMFAGHYHAWQVVTPERVLDWHGETPISLAPGRYFVTVGALCEGDYAVLDTETSLLTPLKVESGVV